ncbi:MAG: hypothetical protein AAF902_10005 [Chloroflexota bacterium]
MNANRFFAPALLVLFLALQVSCGLEKQADLNSNLLGDQEVFIRVHNLSDTNIGYVKFGSQYEKPNSYEVTTYFTEFRSLDVGELSRYKPAHNIAFGQDIMRIENIGEDDRSYAVARRDQLFGGLDVEDLVETAWAWPYEGVDPLTTIDPEKLQRDGLEGGNYTVVITEISSGPQYRVSVQMQRDE